MRKEKKKRRSIHREKDKRKNHNSPALSAFPYLLLRRASSHLCGSLFRPHLSPPKPRTPFFTKVAIFAAMEPELPTSSLPQPQPAPPTKPTDEVVAAHVDAGEESVASGGDGVGKVEADPPPPPPPVAAVDAAESEQRVVAEPDVDEKEGAAAPVAGLSGGEEEKVVDEGGGEVSALAPESGDSVALEAVPAAPELGDGGGGKRGKEADDLEAAEEKALVLRPENGVVNGVLEEPSMKDQVAPKSEATDSEIVDMVSSEVEKSFLEALVESVSDSVDGSGQVDETPQQENAGTAAEVEEHSPEKIEEGTGGTAALPSLPSETSLPTTVNKDAGDEPASPDNSIVDDNSAHGNAIVEEKPAGVEVVDGSGVESNGVNGISESFVNLKSVAASDEDLDQKEVVGARAPSVHDSSVERGERGSREVKQVDVSSKVEIDGDKLDAEEKPAALTIEPTTHLAAYGEERNSETLGKDVNAVEGLKPVSAEDDSLVVEDGDKKQDSLRDAPVIQQKEEVEDKGAGSDEPEAKEASEAAVQIVKELGQGSTGSWELFQKTDGEIVSDSDEEVDSDGEGDGKELFDSAALAALLKAASSGGGDGNITISTADGPSRFFTIERPAGLGPSAPSLKPASRTTRPNIFAPSDLAVADEDDSNLSEEEKKLQEKIHQIRVKFLRLVQRLGHSPEDTVAAQVLYRLNLAEGIRRGRHTNRAFSLESAKMTAAQLEAAGGHDLDFSFNVLILGKSGVGKSATINSIFNEGKAVVCPYEPATSCVKEIVGIVDGVKVRIIDTPGLKSSLMEQGINRKTLYAVKKFTKKCPPDIVLYVDRLDTQTRDFNDIPLLKTISNILGSSIWLNAIVALTHAASAPPEGPNGAPLSYEVFVAQRSHIVQQAIRQAAGDMRLMNPVALVENHPSCRKNRDGQRILPNGQIWRPQLLLLCYSSKILSEANSLLKLQDSSASKLFGFRVRSPPLPYLLSSLLQSRAHPRLPNDQTAEIEDSDIDLADLSDLEQEGEDEYDQLPPFKPLRKAQIEKLSKEQKKAYFEEYDYRVKLLQKKQWREDLRRLKELKKKGKGQTGDDAYGDMVDDMEQDNGAPAAVPVPMPDMVLPPSFDCDNPGYRYRFLEPTSGLLARPVLDTHGWDHDCGYDGVSLESSLAIAGQFPAAVSVQVTKDKKEFNIHLDSSLSAKYGESGSSLAGFDVQTVGRQLAYILRGETKFKNFKGNKTAAGVSVTFLGENVATGLKVEDQISLGKRLSFVGSTGAVRSQGDMAYGANLEARLKDKDFPVGQDHSTLGLSLMKWRGDLALGANLQSQLSLGRSSKMVVRLGLNNKLSGQISVRTSSSEQVQIALIGLLPIATTIIRTLYPNAPYFAN